MEKVQVFYSYFVYKDGVKAGYGSGEVTACKESVYDEVIRRIEKHHDCSRHEIHLIAFNKL